MLATEMHITFSSLTEANGKARQCFYNHQILEWVIAIPAASYKKATGELVFHRSGVCWQTGPLTVEECKRDIMEFLEHMDSCRACEYDW